jgi:hypothetical protein
MRGFLSAFQSYKTGPGLELELDTSWRSWKDTLDSLHCHPLLNEWRTGRGFQDLLKGAFAVLDPDAALRNRYDQNVAIRVNVSEAKDMLQLTISPGSEIPPPGAERTEP